MPLYPVEQVRGQFLGFDTSQLLPNGKILAFSLAGGMCWIIEPDEYGSYRSARVRRVQDMPATSLYGPVTVTNNGNVIVHAGEYGSSIFGYTQMFDPETEQWTSYPTYLAKHSLALLSTDGTTWGEKRLAPNALPTAAQTFTVTSPDGFTGLDLSGASRSGMEATHAMLPNGNVVIAESSSPGQGSYLGEILFNTPTAGNITWRRQNMTFALSGLPRAFRETANNSNDSGRWCSTGDTVRGVTYEPGVLTYMAKLGKVVLVAGNGCLYTWARLGNGDLDFNSLARPAVLPNTKLWNVSNNNSSVVDDKVSLTTYCGVVSDVSLGFNAQQFVSIGSLQFTAMNAGDAGTVWKLLQWRLDGTLPDASAVFVRLSGNTEWVKFLYTGVSYTTGSSTVTVTGLSLARWPGKTNVIISPGDQVSLDRPSYDSRDGCATFLPNGDLMLLAGAGGNSAEGFNSRCRLLKWDGASGWAVEVAEDVTSTFVGGEYAGSLFPLPDGSIWCGFGSNTKVYVPTTAEATPLANSIPVITSAPTSFAAGSRFSLAGTGLTGVHEGGYFSEDRSPRTNFPIVKLRNATSNYVYYCMTRDFTYRGINPGQASSCNVIVPYTVPPGTYQMSVVVNGVSSSEMTVTVGGQSGGEPMFLNRKV